jgi:hypothetical protein
MSGNEPRSFSDSKGFTAPVDGLRTRDGFVIKRDANGNFAIYDPTNNECFWVDKYGILRGNANTFPDGSHGGATPGIGIYSSGANSPSVCVETGTGGYFSVLSHTGTTVFSVLEAGTFEAIANKVCAGFGVEVIGGLDNRRGVTSADGSPLVMWGTGAYNTISASSLFGFKITLIATAYTSGTGTYTITWTENSVAQHIAVSVGVVQGVNNPQYADFVAQPDAGTQITVQLTGTFSATFDVACSTAQIA